MSVPFTEALKTWAKIGCLSFGGPAGQIAMMHKVLVDEKKWLDEKTYLSALNFCMLLPGPEAMQLATYAGWRLHGWRGGLAAGLLFVIPGALVVLGLTIIYALFGQVQWIAALFYGVKAAVLAIVLEALFRVARRALKRRSDWVLAGAAFIALFALDLPFPLVIIAAGLIGFYRASGIAPASQAAPARIDWKSNAGTAGLWLLLWLVPLAAVIATFGKSHVFSEVALFFSKLAVVTFGGAYAVLSYMAQQAVETQGWLSAQEMADGLGLAETTPGPLILVTQFVGFLAGYREGGGLWAGIFAAIITLWMTFTPCFLWIMTGAPYVERLQSMPRVSGALAGITAAVVGVILNLSLWFALHVLFARVGRAEMGWFQPWLPDIASADYPAIGLSLIAAAALLKLHLGLAKTLALSAGLGLVVKLVWA